MKKLRKYHIGIIFLSLLFMLGSCDEEEGSLEEFMTNEPGTITAKIDGENFKSAGVFPITVDLHIDEDYNQYDLQIEGERELNGFEERIIISLFGTDFSSIKAGDVFVGGADLNMGLKRFDGDFFRISRTEGDDTDIISDSEQGPASMATVTKIDFDNRLISGTFSFKSIDISDNTVSFQITDGVFTDIGY
ncbi:hypothetical protein [Saccharicrinis sp. 156]|uniref:hypothetical protein n=1 Tax=Saccharicrinis sp. 156 TaxID=3417574 RepID=UPI003D33E5C8